MSDLIIRTDEQRRDDAAQRLHDYIEFHVRTAPPLTPEQADRLAALLRPDTGGGA